MSRLLIIFLCASFTGCSSDRVAQRTQRPEPHESNIIPAADALVQVDSPESEELDEELPVQLVGLQEYDDTNPVAHEENRQGPPLPEVEMPLSVFEQMALDRNPRLIRLYQEYQAAVSRSNYADKLPDPKIGANIFGDPIETASGSQRANLSFSQAIPWLSKLNAQQQRACFEAFAIQSEYRAERLRVVEGVRTGWYRLYVIDRQIETTKANQQLLQSLIDVANARISTGQASQGDVLLGTLEFSQLEERLLTYRKQRQAVQAEVNRLLARPAATEIRVPSMIEVRPPSYSASDIQQFAMSSQPEIETARLQTQATHWGIEVARLSRRPEVTFSAGYFITDNNRPASTVVDVGQDPWALGVHVSVPLWRGKYDSISNEAAWKHQAARRSVQELSDRYEAIIVDLVSEAKRAADTAKLYESTILPQAEQTLSADQASYTNGAVEFDRVIRDYRSLLTLELGYQQAIGDLGIANARLERAAGRRLNTSNVPSPLPTED